MNRNFIDTMHSLGLFPTILKPTRLTSDTATPTDNIFTKEIGNKVVSGLLINDINNHLPVFATLQNFLKTNIQRNSNTFKLIRRKTPEAIEALKEELGQQ